MASTSVRDRVMLDRYAIRDITGEPSVGDTVVVSLKRKSEIDGKEKESREIGVLTKKLNSAPIPTFQIKLKDENLPEDQWETLDKIGREKFEILVEKSWFDICDRIVTNAALWDTNEEYLKDLEQFLKEEAFMPAGRILAGFGRTDLDLTLFNCFVKAIPEDSRKGITTHFGNLFEIFSRGGGCGFSVDVLRPRNAPVRGVNGRSSGVCSWINHFSSIATTVQQGGSRKGASLVLLPIWHPDIEEFIEFKSKLESFSCPHCKKEILKQEERWKGCNVSVGLLESFMKAVKNEEEWDLIFPDTSDPDYNKMWDGDIETWKKSGKKINTHKKVSAKDLWNKIVYCAWSSGDPGLWFIDRVNNYSNSYYYDRIIASNPCAEEPLPANGICNLGSINLAKFILENVDQFPTKEGNAEEALNKVDFEKLAKAINVGIRFLDTIIDANKYHDDSMQKQAEKERRVGLGILGYAELLIRLGLRYGSDEGNKFTKSLMEFFRNKSYISSINLAKEKGPFPKFEAVKFIDSGFAKTLPDSIRSEINKVGIRNVTVNTSAPTGSTGTMVGTSTGCEPYFSFRWKARSRIGTTTETINIWDEMEAKFGANTKNWPSYAVVADDLTPLEHVQVQALLQRYIDASIAKTINLPNSATIEDVNEAFMAMYDLGCKGGTIYRDGSKLGGQVLYKVKDEEEEPTQLSLQEVEADNPLTGSKEITIEVFSQNGSDPTTVVPLLRPRIECGHSVTFSKDTPIGTMHNTVRFHPVTGEPYDYFCTSGKGDVGADAQALGRLISVILRWPDNTRIPQEVRLQIIMGQLDGILGRGQTGIGPEAVRSLPDGVAKCINSFLEGNFPLAGLPMGDEAVLNFVKKLRACKSEDAAINLVKTGSAYEVEKEEQTKAIEEKLLQETAYQNLDLCPGCGNATLLKIPNHCTHCTNQQCGYEEC